MKTRKIFKYLVGICYLNKDFFTHFIKLIYIILIYFLLAFSVSVFIPQTTYAQSNDTKNKVTETKNENKKNKDSATDDDSEDDSEVEEVDVDSQTQINSQNGPSTTRDKKSIIRFAGIVQFIEGTAERVDSQRLRVKFAHKSPIFEGERFSISNGSVLKFITRNDCIAVIYGSANVLAPEMEKNWQVNSSAMRWICPIGAIDKVSFGNSTFIVGGPSGGEFFIEGNRLIVLSGHVDALKTNGEFPRLTLLTKDGQKWKRILPPAAPIASWKFNQSRKAPFESFLFDRPNDPTPPKVEPKNSRWILGPTKGGANFKLDKSDLSQNDRSIDGARLQAQFKRNRGSLIALFEFSSMGDHQSGYGPNYAPPSSIRSNLLSLQLGYRFDHDRWWSQFVRVGGGLERARITLNSNNGSNYYNSNIEYEFYMLRISYGIDAYYSPSWLSSVGIYAGIDLNAAQSVGRGARSVNNQNSNPGNANPSIADEPWALTTISGQMMLGLMLLF